MYLVLIDHCQVGGGAQCTSTCCAQQQE
jgi:hypothetical protein